MATWPASLPQLPLKPGYSEKSANNSIRSKMDVGPAKTRQRISAGVRDHKMVFLVTDAQLSIFEEFYADTLLSGSVAYAWEHPRTEVPGQWRIKTVPEWMIVDIGMYHLSLELELLP